jgi:hypothetical protein
MPLYRWATVVLTGPWRPSREEAMQDALASGQARLVGGNVVLRSFAKIEEAGEDSGIAPQDGRGPTPAGDAERFVPENAERRLLRRGTT